MSHETITYFTVTWPFIVPILLSTYVWGGTLISFLWSVLTAFLFDKEKRDRNIHLDFMIKHLYWTGTSAAYDAEVTANNNGDREADGYNRTGTFEGMPCSSYSHSVCGFGTLVWMGFCVPSFILIAGGICFELGVNMLPIAVAVGTLYTARAAIRAGTKAKSVLAKLEAHKKDTNAHKGV